MIKQTLDQDLKAALLAKDTQAVMVIRSLKSAILYAEVAAKKRDGDGLSDDEIIGVLQKEAKKRQESADAFLAGGRKEQAEGELSEKVIIERYLPAQLSEVEVTQLVKQAIEELQASDIKAMGQVIGAVKQKAGTAADGAMVAKITREQLGQ